MRRVSKPVFHQLLRRIRTRDDALLVMSAVSQSLYLLALIALVYLIARLPQVWWATLVLLCYVAFFGLSAYFLARRRSRLLALSVLCFALVLLVSAARTTSIVRWDLKQSVCLGLWSLVLVLWILAGANAVRATWIFHRLENSKVLLWNVIVVIVLSSIYGFVIMLSFSCWALLSNGTGILTQGKTLALGGVLGLTAFILGLAGYLPGTRKRHFTTVSSTPGVSQ